MDWYSLDGEDGEWSGRDGSDGDFTGFKASTGLKGFIRFNESARSEVSKQCRGSMLSKGST